MVITGNTNELRIKILGFDPSGKIIYSDVDKIKMQLSM